jgi:DNA-binding transcriptional LysR family regulator
VTIAGMGITMQPTFILHEALRDGRLARLMAGHRWRKLNAFAVYPPTRYLPSRVRAFVDLLMQSFDADAPYWDV